MENYLSFALFIIAFGFMLASILVLLYGILMLVGMVRKDRKQHINTWLFPFMSISFILIFSISTLAGSLFDSISDKLMEKAGWGQVDELLPQMESQANELESAANKLENSGYQDIILEMMKKTLRIYKREGMEGVPENFEIMSLEEIEDWHNTHQKEIESWYNNLPEKKQIELNNEAEQMIKTDTGDIMSIVNEIGTHLFQFKDTTDKMGVALDKFIDGYREVYKDVKSGAIDVTQFPEYKEALKRMPDVVNEYVNGDRLIAFKKFDEITGLFSESKAGQGLGMLLEAADSVNLGKYVAHIIKALSSFSGDSTLNGISESQVELAINDIIRNYKTRLGIGSSSKNAEVIKKELNKYSENVDAFIKMPGDLDKFSNSYIGEFMKKQLEGKGKEALTDVFSKFSGVDKDTINGTGIVDTIFELAGNLFSGK